MQQIKGKVFKFGDNIDTDQIYPGRYLDLSEHSEIALHVMEGADPMFRHNYRPGDIIVAGRNFGCGSREHAVITLKTAGIGLVIAESFARIFYRNAINAAFPVLIAPGAAAVLQAGEEIGADLFSGRIKSSSGKIIQAEKLSDYILQIYRSGGVIPMFQSGSYQSIIG